ncbi:MAG: phenylalanine 4-monooxygenase [Gammaproteobacteria bacterium]|nr:phenylalanine 4-monooxygenase [Gammaproteobacteria bacterium]
MSKSTKYTAKIPDADGIIHYTDDENAIWNTLITRQKAALPGEASQAYMDALELLDFPEDRVPQCEEVSKVLREKTGWEVAPVPALINFPRFFGLLANKRFPAATFIRTRDELDYLQEPDIFHELFGHTPHLTDPRFAAFTHAYGRAGVMANQKDQAMLARLYWFTVEFGLIDSGEGLRTYGAGIVSSIGETQYALHSDKPVRKPFDPIDVLRTPYRIDIYQPVYFVLESFDQLFELAQQDLLGLINQARELGMHEPLFPPPEKVA